MVPVVPRVVPWSLGPISPPVTIYGDGVRRAYRISGGGGGAKTRVGKSEKYASINQCALRSIGLVITVYCASVVLCQRGVGALPGLHLRQKRRTSFKK